MLGDNLKFHFACAERQENFDMLSRAGVHYMLATAYPYIKRIRQKSKTLVSDSMTPPQMLRLGTQHAIMDSGLYSLLFGQEKGYHSEAELYSWFDMLVDFIKMECQGITCVEVDAQKFLGVAKTWELRERFKALLPGTSIINAIHVEDDAKSIDRMIEFSDYIAISTRECRHLYQDSSFSVIRNLVMHIKSKKPAINIHLLGWGESVGASEFRGCTSADASNWQGAVRFTEPFTNWVRGNPIPSILVDRMREIKPKASAVNIRNTIWCEELIHLYKDFNLLTYGDQE